jgi:hypothetical protein
MGGGELEVLEKLLSVLKGLHSVRFSFQVLL